MLKKSLCLLFAVLLFSGFAFAQEGLESGVDDVREKAETIRDLTGEEKWDYIGNQWKEILLKNKFIAPVDEFFRNIPPPVFLIVLGVNYDLSIVFFFSFIYWLFFFLILTKAASRVSMFKGFSILVGLAASILLGAIKFYYFLSNVTLNLLFYDDGYWIGIWSIIFFVIYIFVLIFVYKYIDVILRVLGKSKESKEKSEFEIERRELKEITKNLE